MAEDPANDPIIVRLRIPYEFLDGDDIVNDGISEENTMLQILHWIGFIASRKYIHGKYFSTHQVYVNLYSVCTCHMFATY